MLLSISRYSLIALILAAWMIDLAPSTAGEHEPLQRLGRLVGAGWGDGYHACKDSGFRPGANLPPRSYHKQFNQAANGHVVGSRVVSGRSYYDCFDASARCQGCGGVASSCGGTCRGNGHCASNACDAAPYQTALAAPAGTYLVPPQPTEFEPVTSPNHAGMSLPMTMRFASEMAESQKRPIRPLPPRTTRRISIPDPPQRPIRPTPPPPALDESAVTMSLPVINVPTVPKLTDGSQLSSDRKIVNRVLNSEFGIPGFDGSTPRAVPQQARQFPIKPADPITKSDSGSSQSVTTTTRVDLAPRISTVPDWKVLRQPR